MRTFSVWLAVSIYMIPSWAGNVPLSQKTMEISGMGLDSCASLVLALNENRPTAAVKMDGKTYLTEAGAYTQWIVGFVNAIRWVSASAETFSNGKRVIIRPLPADVNAIALSVKKRCEDKPDLSIFQAVTDYINNTSK